MSVELTDATLRSKMFEATYKEASKNIGDSKRKFDSASEARERANERMFKLLEDARKKQKKADELAEKAENSGMFKAGKNARKAADAADAFTQASLAAEKAKTQAEVASREAQRSVENMQRNLKYISHSDDKINRMRAEENKILNKLG